MGEERCPYHLDHENRITNLEVDMKEVKKNQRSPALYVALIGFFGTTIATVGSIVGAIVAAYLRVEGYI